MKRLILIFVSIFSIVFASQANIYIVNSNADAGAGAGLTGDLRYCINQAAGAVGPHTIMFSTAMTITINSDLQINAGNHNGITINGFVDLLDGPDVIIRSGGTLNNQMIFNNTAGAKVYGLVFQNLDYGIHLNGATTTQIKGCYFGTNAAGTAIVNGINQAGVFIEKGGLSNANALIANNIVGGLLSTLPNGLATLSNNSERCIFAGCSQKTDAGAGVRVPALLVKDAGGTQVVNNYFGIDVTGAVKLGNGNQTTKMPLAHSNIYMNNAANSVIDRNVIAGATGSGIHLENWCNNAKIKGNKIGTNAAGTAAYNVTNTISFSNEAAGIFIQGGTGIVIGYDGGVITNERNIIAGNGGAKHNNWEQTCDGGFSDYNQFGIYTESLGSSTIKGNYIGTDVTGNTSGVGNVFGNRAGGIKMVTVTGVGSSNSQNNIIGGGTTVNDRNIISGNGYLWKANDNTSTCNGGIPNPSNMVGGPGLLLQYANTSGNTVSGNYVGLGADGLTALGNNANGIEIQGAASNNIGTPGVPNYICNNTWGIFLQVDFGTPFVPAANNIIAGNIIGLTPTNTVLGNGVRTGLTEGGGIGMQMGVNGTKIGTAVANGGNVISGNRIGVGIQTNSVTAGATAPNGNTMYNNIIGLDPTGTISKPNTSFGVSIDMGGQGTVFPFNNTIGGTGANQPNTISSNQQSGVYISNATAITAGTANSIVGNKIGTNTAGTGSFGNTQQGIEIVNVSKTTITSNIISNNSQNGISLTGTTINTIQLNTITANSVNGISLASSSSNNILSNTISTNASNGISLTGSSSNTIQGNTINSNTSNGISLAAASASNIILTNTINTNGVNGVVVNGGTSINNAINQNSFSCNTGRGIVLSAGGNASYGAPIINGTQTQIIWTGGVFVEVYETDGCATCPADPTRLQGKTLIASGNSPFTFTTALGFDKTKTYTATTSSSASAGAHNTSEFSQCYTLCQNPTSVTITGAPLTFCAGGSVTLTANVVGGSGTETYVWKKDNVVIGGNTTTLLAVASGSYTVDYSSTTTCSTTTSAAVTVTVNPRPTVTSSATGTVCSGIAQNYTITASVPSSFAWTRAAVTGITPNTGSGSTATITETLTNTTTAPVDVVYLITPTSTTGSCPSSSPFTYTVTVNPKPTVTSSATGTICSGDAQNYTITSSVASSFAWSRATVTGITPATGSGTTNTITEALTNTTNAPISVAYTITPTSTTGSCAGSAFTYTVTVNPKPAVTSSATGTVCSGVAQNYTITSGVASSFAWTRAAVTGITPATGSGSTNTITETLTNAGTTALTVTYIVTPTSTTGSCPGSPFTYTVTVNPKPTITSSAAGTVCSGDAQNYTITSSVASNFAWSRAAVTGITPATGSGTTNTITEVLTNTTTAPINIVYTITPTATTGSCAGVAVTYTVTVNPKPAVTSSATGAICSGVAQNYTITSNVASSFSWTRAAVTGITPATGSGTTNTITETLVNPGTTPLTVTYLITPTSTTGSCPGTPFTYTVTVNPAATVTSSATGAICSGDAQNYTITSSVVSSFIWSRAAVTGITPATGSGTTNTITESLTNSTTAPISIVYTITPTASTGSCPGSAFTYTVTVDPKPAVTSSATGSVCSGVAQNYTITSSVASSFSWTRAAVTGITPATGSGTTNTITETLVNPGTTPLAVTYLITPTSTSGSCPGTPFTYTVTVNPAATVTSSATGAICSGDAQNYTITSSVVSSFIWSRAAVTGVSPATGSGNTNTITEALTNSTNAAIIVEYTITPTATTGSCPGSTFTYTVTVNPKPAVTSSTTGAVCSGDAQNYTITSNVASSFTWTRAAVTNISPATGSGVTSSITESLTNSSSTAISVVYIITPTSTTGSCLGTPFTYTVTVNPGAIVTSSATGTVCSGVAQNYSITSNVTSSFTWTRAGVTGISPATGSGTTSSITEVLTNTTASSIIVEYIITATSTTGSCVGSAFTYTVTVDPKPAALITVSGSPAFCSGGSVDLTASASGFTGGTFEWFDANSTSLGNANPLTVSAAGSFYVIYTSTSSCGSNPSASVSTSISPDNSFVALGDDYSTCLSTVELVANIPAFGTGSWSVVLPSSATVTPTSSSTKNTADADNLIDGNVYKFVYTVSGACGDDKTDTISVTAGLPGFTVAASGPSDTVCVKTNRTLLANASGGSGNYTYVWVSSDKSYKSNGNKPVITVQPVNETTVYIVYVVDNSNPGCKTVADSVDISATKGQDLYLVNLITPNGDNQNDIFYLKDKVTGQPMFKQGSHIEVVNRWGSKVYEADNYDNTWVPKELTDGMYYYHITNQCGNKEYKSWLQILGNTNN